MLTVHRTIFPFYRQWPLIINNIQCANNLFKIDFTSSDASEVPITTRVTKRDMPAKNTYLFGCITPIDIFHVDMKNPLWKLVNKIHVIHALIAQMTGVIIKSECWMMIDCVECSTSRNGIKSNLCRMYF